jgi:hypothetical protein
MAEAAGSLKRGNRRGRNEYQVPTAASNAVRLALQRRTYWAWVEFFCFGVSTIK